MRINFNKIDEFRHSKKLSETKFAAKTDMSRGTYNNLRNGKTVTVDTLIKIADFMKVHPGELFTIPMPSMYLGKEVNANEMIVAENMENNISEKNNEWPLKQIIEMQKEQIKQLEDDKVFLKEMIREMKGR